MSKRIAGMVLLGLLLVASLGAQGTPRTFEPFQPTPAYLDAMEQVQYAGPERKKGVEHLLEIARQNPNTTLGATCLFSAATYCGKRSEAADLYRRIAAEYANSGFELQARMGIVGLESETPAQWLAGADELLRRYGAPNLDEIAQNPCRAALKLRGLRLDYQHGLISLYNHLAQLLQTDELARHREALAVSYFGEEAFSYDARTTSRFRSWKRWSLAELHGGQNAYSTMGRQPEVRIRSPHAGHLGEQPVIRLQTTLRDSTSCPINLARSTFFLDGLDVHSSVRLRNLRLNPTAGPRQIFEQMLIEFQPTQPLSAGRHRFQVFLVSSGDGKGGWPGSVRLDIPFDVRPGRPHCDDERRWDSWDDED